MICDESATSLNGTWILTTLRVRRPDVRVLLITANEFARTLAGDGHTGFLRKPFTIEALELAVVKLAGRRL